MAVTEDLISAVRTTLYFLVHRLSTGKVLSTPTYYVSMLVLTCGHMLMDA